jgi:hypothetical protein
MMVRDLGGGTDAWTLMLAPRPPRDPQWLDLVTAPGQSAVRVGLDPSARPPQDATVTAGPVTAGPGDHLLRAVAARLLAKAGPDGFPLRQSAPWPGPLVPGAGGRWHATRTLGQSGIALRVEVVPPLSRATTGIEVITTGPSAEARARLPLRWE